MHRDLLSLGHKEEAQAEYQANIVAWTARRDAWDVEQKSAREEVKQTNKRVRDEETNKKENAKAEKEKQKFSVGGFKALVKGLDDKYPINILYIHSQYKKHTLILCKRSSSVPQHSARLGEGKGRALQTSTNSS